MGSMFPYKNISVIEAIYTGRLQPPVFTEIGNKVISQG